MKKLLLSAACVLAFMSLKAQSPADSAAKSRKLKLEEINFVSSYYNQTGDNAAVTGGIGSQKLTDIANIIDLQFVKYDKKYRKHTLTGELGIDHYTSASSDLVDLKANSSASHADTRIYPSVNWSVQNEQKGNTFGIGVSSSKEYDYLSLGANINFTKTSKDKNTELTAKAQYFADQVKLITPVELRTGGGRGDDYGSSARNTIATSLSLSRVVNKSLQVMILGDYIAQNGFLSLPFYRVYFTDGSVHQEKLPDTRTKIPIAARANYFAGDKVIFRTYYRYYQDDWGIHSNTAELETSIKLNSFLSVTPFYRYYKQTAADYFAPYQKHTAANTYYTSNFDLSAFSSNFFGVGVRTAPVNGVFGNKHIKSMEIRGGHYSKNIAMQSNIISLNLNFK